MQQAPGKGLAADSLVPQPVPTRGSGEAGGWPEKEERKFPSLVLLL